MIEMVTICEPDRASVERAVRATRLVLALVSRDPLARGAQDMVEAVWGTDLRRDLVRWLRLPNTRRRLRDTFIERLEEIYSR